MCMEGGEVYTASVVKQCCIIDIILFTFVFCFAFDYSLKLIDIFLQVFSPAMLLIIIFQKFIEMISIIKTKLYLNLYYIIIKVIIYSYLTNEFEVLHMVSIKE